MKKKKIMSVNQSVQKSGIQENKKILKQINPTVYARSEGRGHFHADAGSSFFEGGCLVVKVKLIRIWLLCKFR